MTDFDTTPSDVNATLPVVDEPPTDAPTVIPTDAPPAKVSRPRAPKFTATFDGQTFVLEKYAFPIKPVRFEVLVDGVKCDAAGTSGKAKSYTYILIKNVSFWVPVVVAADTVITTNIPANFDGVGEVEVRKSYYKPKAAADGAPEPTGDAPAATGEAVAPTPEEAVAPDAPKAARRARK